MYEFRQRLPRGSFLDSFFKLNMSMHVSDNRPGNTTDIKSALDKITDMVGTV